MLGARRHLQGASVDSLLAEGADAALELYLQPSKWDLCFNPARFDSWELLAAAYHSTADALLVSEPARRQASAFCLFVCSFVRWVGG